MSSSDNRPIRSPSLDRGTVVILSIFKLLGWCSPFSSSGATGRRIKGALMGSGVNAQTVTEAVASKRTLRELVLQDETLADYAPLFDAGASIANRRSPGAAGPAAQLAQRQRLDAARAEQIVRVAGVSQP